MNNKTTTSKILSGILTRVANRNNRMLSQKAVAYINSLMNEINTGFYPAKGERGFNRSSYTGEARDEVLQIRLTKGEKDLLRANSEQIGIGMADYLRVAVFNLEKTLAEQEED